MNMFSRFTERARKVIILAKEEAKRFNHDYIGTEHVLLGLLREEQGLAALALEGLDITVERVRAQVVRIVGSGEEVTTGQTYTWDETNPLNGTQAVRPVNSR